MSSFGFSGTNAHVVVEEAPASAADRRPIERGPRTCWRSRRAASRRCASWQSASARRLEPSRACRWPTSPSAPTRPRHLPHRLAVRAGRPTRRASSGRPRRAARRRHGLSRGRRAGPDAPQVAFLFTGQGAQYAGMGRGLYEQQPVFRQALDRCAAIVAPAARRPLLEVLFGERGRQRELARPDGVHAAGAVRAGVGAGGAVAGVGCQAGRGARPQRRRVRRGLSPRACWTSRTALRLVAARGRLMQALPAGGAMAAVFAPEAGVAALRAPHRVGWPVAAVNGPEHVVVSGAGGARRGDRGRRSAPGRSGPAPERLPRLPLAADGSDARRFEAVAATLRPAPPRSAGVEPDGAAAAARRDRRRLLAPPRARARALRRRRAHAGEPRLRVFIEIGPHRRCSAWPQAAPAGEGTWLPSLRAAGRLEAAAREARELCTAASRSTGRASIATNRRTVALPTYPFERERHWLAPGRPAVAARPPGRRGHPLLGRRLRSPLRGAQFEHELGAGSRPTSTTTAWSAAVLPGDRVHRVAGGGRRVRRARPPLEDVELLAALVVPRREVAVQLVAARPTRAAALRGLSASRRRGQRRRWRLHARPGAPASCEPRPVDLDGCGLAARSGAGRRTPTCAARLGVELGPVGGRRLWRGDGEALAEVGCPPTSTRGLPSTRPCSTAASSCRAVLPDRPRPTCRSPSSVSSGTRARRALCWSHVTSGPAHGERRDGHGRRPRRRRRRPPLLTVHGRAARAGRPRRAAPPGAPARAAALRAHVAAGADPPAASPPPTRCRARVALAAAVTPGPRARAPVTTSPATTSSRRAGRAGGRLRRAALARLGWSGVAATRRCRRPRRAAGRPAALSPAARPLSRDPRRDRRAAPRVGRMDGGQAAVADARRAAGDRCARGIRRRAPS